MYRQSEKNLLNSNISSTSFLNMVNFSPPTAEIGSGVWGTPANFNGFCVLASLLQRRCSLEANQTLHNIWPSPGQVHYVYIFGALAPNRTLPRAKLTLRPSLAFSYIGSITVWHSSSGVSQTLQNGICNCLRAPPIIGWVAITLGIGPLSSSSFLSAFFPCLFSAVRNWMSTILPHMMWLEFEFRLQV